MLVRKYRSPYLWNTIALVLEVSVASAIEGLANRPTFAPQCTMISVLGSILSARCTTHSPAGISISPARNSKGTFPTSLWLLPNCADARRGIIVTTIANIRIAYFISRLQIRFAFIGESEAILNRKGKNVHGVSLKRDELF